MEELGSKKSRCSLVPRRVGVRIEKQSLQVRRIPSPFLPEVQKDGIGVEYVCYEEGLEERREKIRD